MLSIVAVFFSLSRGGLVGIACLAIYWVVATGRFRRRVLVAAIVLCIGIPLFPSFVFERLQTVELNTSYQSEGSAAERLMIAKAALKAALDNPVVGVGPRNFQHVAPIYGSTGDLMVSHSLWLQAAAEFGFPMLITFVVLIVYLLMKLGRERRAARQRKDSETEMLATALACSLIGFLAAGTFTSQFMAPYLWGLLGVIGAFIAHCGYKRNQGELDPQGETKEAETATPQPARTA